MIPTFPEVIRANSAAASHAHAHAHRATPTASELAREVVDADRVKQLRDATPAASSTTTVATTTPATSPPPANLANASDKSPPTSPTPASRPDQTCASVIADVEARGLFPAPGFVVTCPGDAMGHAGMTCLNVASVCPGRAEIIIHYVAAYVVANEFENSRILSGAPARCHEIDCGHIAYGF